MNRRIALLALIACCAAGSAQALYLVQNHGAWPQSWPKELEPVRKHSRTLVGPEILYRHYHVPFTNREEFEAAWPHFLKVKSKGAPIILVRAPKTDFFAIKPAGLLIHSPPEGAEKEKGYSGSPISGHSDPRRTWANATYFELVVDGKIVNLNRIALPTDTPIFDERFKSPDDNSPVRKTK